MKKLKVKIQELGYSTERESYFVTYQVSNLEEDSLNKLQERLEDPIIVKGDNLYLTVYFEEKYYPFRSAEAQRNPADFIAREELEMTAYLLDLLED